MSTLKTGLIVFGLAIGSAAIAQEGTQDRKSTEERAHARTEKMAEELSLTEEQQAKMEAVNAQAIEKRKEILNNASLTEEQRKAGLKANHEATKAQIAGILTPDQQAKLEAKKEAFQQQREERQDRTPEEKAQFRTDRMAEELALTEDQKAKVQASNLKAVQKETSIRSGNLTEEQQKTALKESRQSQKAELKKILTKEQLAMLKAKKEEHKERCGKPQQEAPKQ
jgi:protein CpxP